jgi:uncharacterized protein (TIGR02246 family)
MKNVFLVLLLGFVLCFAYSCEKEDDDVAEVEIAAEGAMDLLAVRQLIEKANIKFGEAVRSGDASALANLYTEDATLLPPPNAPIIKGRQGVEAYWTNGFQMGLKEVVLATVEVMAMGDMVCEIGNANVTFQPEGMDSFKDVGKYLVIWKNVGGTWKLHVDIYNSGLPAQGE